MNQTSKEARKAEEKILRESRRKLLPFVDYPEHESPSIDSITEKELEVVRIMLLQRINRQTLRTSKNIAFLLWMFIITLIIFILSTQITGPLR